MNTTLLFWKTLISKQIERLVIIFVIVYLKKKNYIIIAWNFNLSISTYGSLVYVIVRNAWYKIKVCLVMCIIHDLWTHIIFFCCHIPLHIIIVVLHIEKSFWLSKNKKRRFYRLLPIYETRENDFFFFFFFFEKQERMKCICVILNHPHEMWQ